MGLSPSLQIATTEPESLTSEVSSVESFDSDTPQFYFSKNKECQEGRSEFIDRNSYSHMSLASHRLTTPSLNPLGSVLLSLAAKNHNVNYLKFKSFKRRLRFRCIVHERKLPRIFYKRMDRKLSRWRVFKSKKLFLSYFAKSKSDKEDEGQRILGGGGVSTRFRNKQGASHQKPEARNFHQTFVGNLTSVSAGGKKQHSLQFSKSAQIRATSRMNSCDDGDAVEVGCTRYLSAGSDNLPDSYSISTASEYDRVCKCRLDEMNETCVCQEIFKTENQRPIFNPFAEASKLMSKSCRDFLKYQPYKKESPSLWFVNVSDFVLPVSPTVEITGTPTAYLLPNTLLRVYDVCIKSATADEAHLRFKCKEGWVTGAILDISDFESSPLRRCCLSWEGSSISVNDMVGSFCGCGNTQHATVGCSLCTCVDRFKLSSEGFQGGEINHHCCADVKAQDEFSSDCCRTKGLRLTSNCNSGTGACSCNVSTKIRNLNSISSEVRDRYNASVISRLQKSSSVTCLTGKKWGERLESPKTNRLNCRALNNKLFALGTARGAQGLTEANFGSHVINVPIGLSGGSLNLSSVSRDFAPGEDTDDVENSRPLWSIGAVSLGKLKSGLKRSKYREKKEDIKGSGTCSCEEGEACDVNGGSEGNTGSEQDDAYGSYRGDDGGSGSGRKHLNLTQLPKNGGRNKGNACSMCWQARKRVFMKPFANIVRSLPSRICTEYPETSSSVTERISRPLRMEFSTGRVGFQSSSKSVISSAIPCVGRKNSFGESQLLLAGCKDSIRKCGSCDSAETLSTAATLKGERMSLEFLREEGNCHWAMHRSNIASKAVRACDDERRVWGWFGNLDGYEEESKWRSRFQRRVDGRSRIRRVGAYPRGGCFLFMVISPHVIEIQSCSCVGSLVVGHLKRHQVFVGIDITLVCCCNNCSRCGSKKIPIEKKSINSNTNGPGAEDSSNRKPNDASDVIENATEFTPALAGLSVMKQKLGKSLASAISRGAAQSGDADYLSNIKAGPGPKCEEGNSGMNLSNALPCECGLRLHSHIKTNGVCDGLVSDGSCQQQRNILRHDGCSMCSLKSRRPVMRIRTLYGWVTYSRDIEKLDEEEVVYSEAQVYEVVADGYLVNIRSSLEVQGPVTRTLPPASKVEVMERRINREGVVRLRVHDGWINERRLGVEELRLLFAVRISEAPKREFWCRYILTSFLLPILCNNADIELQVAAATLIAAFCSYKQPLAFFVLAGTDVLCVYRVLLAAVEHFIRKWNGIVCSEAHEGAMGDQRVFCSKQLASRWNFDDHISSLVRLGIPISLLHSVARAQQIRAAEPSINLTTSMHKRSFGGTMVRGSTSGNIRSSSCSDRVFSDCRSIYRCSASILRSSNLSACFRGGRQCCLKYFSCDGSGSSTYHYRLLLGKHQSAAAGVMSLLRTFFTMCEFTPSLKGFKEFDDLMGFTSLSVDSLLIIVEKVLVNESAIEYLIGCFKNLTQVASVLGDVFQRRCGFRGRIRDGLTTPSDGTRCRHRVMPQQSTLVRCFNCRSCTWMDCKGGGDPVLDGNTSTMEKFCYSVPVSNSRFGGTVRPFGFESEVIGASESDHSNPDEVTSTGCFEKENTSDFNVGRRFCDSFGQQELNNDARNSLNYPRLCSSVKKADVGRVGEKDRKCRNVLSGEVSTQTPVSSNVCGVGHCLCINDNAGNNYEDYQSFSRICDGLKSMHHYGERSMSFEHKNEFTYDKRCSCLTGEEGSIFKGDESGTEADFGLRWTEGADTVGMKELDCTDPLYHFCVAAVYSSLVPHRELFLPSSNYRPLAGEAFLPLKQVSGPGINNGVRGVAPCAASSFLFSDFEHKLPMTEHSKSASCDCERYSCKKSKCAYDEEVENRSGANGFNHFKRLMRSYYEERFRGQAYTLKVAPRTMPSNFILHHAPVIQIHSVEHISNQLLVQRYVHERNVILLLKENVVGRGRDMRRYCHNDFKRNNGARRKGRCQRLNHIQDKKDVFSVTNKEASNERGNIEGGDQFDLRSVIINPLLHVPDENTVLGQLNEFFLFHGCNEAKAESIAYWGFDCRRGGESGGQLFGAGTYFTPHASKADLYTKATSNGTSAVNSRGGAFSSAASRGTAAATVGSGSGVGPKGSTICSFKGLCHGSGRRCLMNTPPFRLRKACTRLGRCTSAFSRSKTVSCDRSKQRYLTRKGNKYCRTVPPGHATRNSSNKQKSGINDNKCTQESGVPKITTPEVRKSRTLRNVKLTSPVTRGKIKCGQGSSQVDSQTQVDDGFTEFEPEYHSLPVRTLILARVFLGECYVARTPMPEARMPPSNPKHGLNSKIPFDSGNLFTMHLHNI